MIILPKSVGCISQACAKDTSQRCALSAVHVVADREEQFWLEATDGKILAVVRGPKLTEGGGPELDGPLSLDDFLVHAADWNKVFKAIDLKDRIGKGCIGLAASENEIQVSTPNGEVRFPAAEGRFPDVAMVLPKTGTFCRVVVDPYLLMDLLKIAIGISDSKERPQVVLHFYGPNQPMGVTARHAESGNTFDGLLMPLSHG